MQLNFIRFEIEQRKHSPNAVIGIHEVMVEGKPKEKRLYITAASISLGKKLGDLLALQVKQIMEDKYLKPVHGND